MSRLQQHLEHILTDVVPSRGAAQDGLAEGYLAEIEARGQPPLLVRGLEQWNAGHFFEQHETLEWLWRATAEPVRDLFKGIILAGVGALHVQRENRRGALGKWTGAMGYLEPFEARRPYGIEVGALRQQVSVARAALLAEEEGPHDWQPHRERVAALHIVWEPRPTDPQVTHLLRRLDRAWQESELGVEPTLAGTSEEEAAWQPAAGVRPIRAVLAQLGVGKWVVANHCFGDGALGVGDVRVPASWPALKRWLLEAHEAIREPLGFLRDEQLGEPRTLFGNSLPLERIIEATIEQDFYHAGEINNLRELCRAMGSGAG